jgi:hypothetical protein
MAATEPTSGRNSVSVHGRARTSVPLTAGHLGTATNAAGHLPIRTTLAAGSPPPSAQRGPGAGRAPGRVRSAAAAVRVTGGHQGGDGGLAGRDVPLQGGEPWPGCAAAAPGSGPCARRTTTPGGRLVFHGCAALAEFIGGLIVEGFALSGAATGQHGQAALLAWLCRAPDAQVRGDLGGRRGARCRRGPRSHPTSGPWFPGWYGGRPRHCLICCWMTSGAGRASTV